MTLSALSRKKFAQAVRRNSQHRKATIDTNADFNGRRPSGDARLDLAVIDRHFKI